MLNHDTLLEAGWLIAVPLSLIVTVIFAELVLT
jgi:hypothetical protein